MFAAGGASAAQESGFYAAVEAGYASHRGELNVDGVSPVLTTEDERKRALTWALVLGYHFSPEVAVEVGYADLGELVTTLSDDQGGDVAQVRVSHAAKGATFALLAHHILGDWDPFVRFGVIASQATRETRTTIGATEIETSHRSSALRPFLGLGLRYAFREDWALSFTVDYYWHVGRSMDVGENDVLAPKLGLAYRF
jgi:hypothetical protein